MMYRADPRLLRREMRRRSLSVRELARQAHLDVQTVRKALEGRPITPASGQLISQALDAIPVFKVQIFLATDD